MASQSTDLPPEDDATPPPGVLTVREQLTPPIPTSPDPHAPLDIGEVGRMAWTYANHGFYTLICWGINDDLTCACGGRPGCKPGKHPMAGRGFPLHGKDSATTNPDIVAGWYRRALAEGIPANVAIKPRKGQSFMDADDPSRPAVQTARALLLAAGAPMQTTGREDGWHAFLRVGRNGPLKGTGVEFKGNGEGYVVVAPSMSATGRRYGWLQGGRPIEEPDGLIDGLTASQPHHNGVEATGAVLIHLVDDFAVGEGERYNTYRDEALALYVEGYLGKPEAVKAILRAKLTPRFTPPYAELDWLHAETEVVDRDHHPEHIGDTRRLVSLWRAGPSFGAGNRPAEPPGAGKPEEDARTVLRASRVVASTATKPETGDWVVPGLLRKGKVCVLASDEGLGKTTMARELAVRGAGAGGQFLNIYPVPGRFKTVIVDEENGEDEEWEREEGLADVLASPRSSWGERYVHYSYLGVALDEPSGQALLKAIVADERPDVLVLDTGGQMVGEEHGAKFKTAFGFLLGLANSHQVAILVLVHMVKPLRNLMTGKPFTTAKAVAEVTGHWTKRAQGVGVLSSADDDDSRFFWRTFKRIPKRKAVLSRADGLWSAEAWVEPAPAAVMAGRALGRTATARAQTLNFLQTIRDGRPISVKGGTNQRTAARVRDEGLATQTGSGWVLTEAGFAALPGPVREPDSEPDPQRSEPDP